MNQPSPRLVCAIDAQISSDVSGGTETALLSLISALGAKDTDERFVLLGLKGSSSKLVPFTGPNQTVVTWPWLYSWYSSPATPAPMSHRWRRLHSVAGPFDGAIEWLHQHYASGHPLGARARRLHRRLGPLGFLVPPAYRLYRGFRYGRSRTVTAAQADSRLRDYGARVVHFPYPLHFPTRVPFVYEPWGLPHLHFPELFQPGEPAWMDALFRAGCKAATIVVTATHWVKQDIVTRYGIPAEKIAVIPRLPKSLDVVTPKFRSDLPGEFALFPAMTWPTKNHIGLLRALARLRDQHRVKLHLVCTGRIYQAHWPNIEAELNRLRLADQVRFLGSVSREELRGLFTTARFLVFPSRFEGLGLPLIEAFQHGLPVLASRAACIPEVVGDAGLLFDPDDDEDIARTLLRALRTPALLEDLRARGKARLSSFSAERMADMFITCYRRAARVSLSREQEQLWCEMTGPRSTT